MCVTIEGFTSQDDTSQRITTQVETTQDAKRKGWQITG